MSQPYHPNNYTQQCYHPGSYDTTQPTQMQSHAQTYGDNHYYYESDVVSSVQPADKSSDLAQALIYSEAYNTMNESSELAQTFTYSELVYVTDSIVDNLLSYNPSPDHVVPRYSDSPVPQPQVVPGRDWGRPALHAEVPAAHPIDFHVQRRNSCTSSTDGDAQYSQGNLRQYNHLQSIYEQTRHQALTFCYQSADPIDLGMHSPTQYLQIRYIAHDAPHEIVNHSKVKVPYGTLPIHKYGVQCEASPSQQSPNAVYQTSENSVGHHSTQSPPTFTQAYYPSVELSAPPSPQRGSSDSTQSQVQDLFVQQRRAAGYQHMLQMQQERKYQLSGQFQQFAVNQPHTNNQQCARHRPYHRPTDHHQRPSSERSQLMPAPIVPSQVHERTPSAAWAAPKAQGKKEVVSKRPALACMFCRKRKIACGARPPTDPDRTCNQCARRGQECHYPTVSRRGIRPPKEPVPKEPIVHRFVDADGSQDKSGIGPICHGHRKRTSS